MSASAKFAKQALFALAKVATIVAMAAGSAACSQYAQSSRADTATQAPAINAILIDSAASARYQYLQQNREWKNLLAHGTNPALFETHLQGFGASAMHVQKDLAQMQKLMRRMDVSTHELDALKAAHQEMVMRQFEAFHANYDKTGADSASQRKVEHAVADTTAAFSAAMDKFVGEMTQGKWVQ